MAWEMLFNESGAWVLIVCAGGIVREANSVSLASFGRRRDEAIGRPLAELLPPLVAAERLEFAAKAIASGRMLRVDGMIGGSMRRCAMHPIIGRPDQADCVLMLDRALEPQAVPAEHRARHDDRGLLENLTQREVEVLTLIGTGRTTAQIAKVLHRSVKTIEWHRVSLGTKLGASNRVELARIAIRLGLVHLGDTPDADSAALGGAK